MWVNYNTVSYYTAKHKRTNYWYAKWHDISQCHYYTGRGPPTMRQLIKDVVVAEWSRFGVFLIDETRVPIIELDTALPHINAADCATARHACAAPWHLDSDHAVLLSPSSLQCPTSERADFGGFLF